MAKSFLSKLIFGGAKAIRPPKPTGDPKLKPVPTYQFKSEHDAELAKLDAEISILKEKNREWGRLFSQLNSLYELAVVTENKDLNEAIKKHWDVINFAEGHTPINKYNHYARSVRRLAVLYRKTKNYEEEVLLIDQYKKNDKTIAARLKKAKDLLLKSNQSL